MDHPEDKSGELPDFQQTVTDFIEEHGIEAPAYAQLLDLSSEAGELSKEYLRTPTTAAGLSENRRTADQMNLGTFSFLWSASPTAPA